METNLTMQFDLVCSVRVKHDMRQIHDFDLYSLSLRGNILDLQQKGDICRYVDVYCDSQLRGKCATSAKLLIPLVFVKTLLLVFCL